jgi:hypothetical protein
MKKSNSGNSTIGIVILIGVIWGISSLFSTSEPENNKYRAAEYTSTPTYPSYRDNDVNSGYYTEPENPYDEGSGHSAGYEWAEENDVDSCDGNSNSFIEGCEEYLDQKAQAEEEFDQDEYDDY